VATSAALAARAAFRFIRVVFLVLVIYLETLPVGTELQPRRQCLGKKFLYPIGGKGDSIPRHWCRTPNEIYPSQDNLCIRKRDLSSQLETWNIFTTSTFRGQDEWINALGT